jgi:hypothetical protein
MSEKYDNQERAALFELLLADRDVPNTELTNQYKIRLGPAARDKLNKAELLLTRSENRRLVHRITDKGIAWCMEDLVDGESPSKAGPLARVQSKLLRHLAKYHQQHGTLLEAIRSGGLESLIRSVYLDLSVMPQDWVRLAKLRPKLNGADRAEVDEVLLNMVKSGTAHLVPDSNRKVLTEADHAAAIRIGSEDKHLMAIEES